MGNLNKTFFLFCVFCLFLGCGATSNPSSDTTLNSLWNSATDGIQRGTIATNPQQPQLNYSIMPYIPDYINTLNVDLSSDDVVSKSDVVYSFVDLQTVIRILTAIDNVNKIEEDMMHYGDVISQALQAQGIVAEDATRTFMLTDVDDLADWLSLLTSVGIKKETTNKDYTEFEFRDQNTGTIYGKYIYQGAKAIFVTVNPGAIVHSDTGHMRMFVVMMDFSNPNECFLTIQLDGHNAILDRYVTQHIMYQCDATLDKCVAEVLENHESAGTVAISDNKGYRFSWSKTDPNHICYSIVDYATTTPAVLTPILLEISRTAPALSGLSCSIDPKPIWSDHSFSSNIFLLRPLDFVTMPEGTAAYLVGDGITTHWADITSDMIQEGLREFNYY